jgi:hypothetical protein
MLKKTAPTSSFAQNKPSQYIIFFGPSKTAAVTISLLLLLAPVAASFFRSEAALQIDHGVRRLEIGAGV